MISIVFGFFWDTLYNTIVDRVSFVFSSNRPLGYGWSNMQVITFDTTQHYSNLRLPHIYTRQLRWSIQSVIILTGVWAISKNKLYAWKPLSTMLLQTNSMAFQEIVIRASPLGIPQTSLGLRGHLITNLPQAVLLLIIIQGE